MRYVYYSLSSLNLTSNSSEDEIFEVIKKQEPDMVSFKVLKQYSEIQVLVKE